MKKHLLISAVLVLIYSCHKSSTPPPSAPKSPVDSTETIKVVVNVIGLKSGQHDTIFLSMANTIENDTAQQGEILRAGELFTVTTFPYTWNCVFTKSSLALFNLGWPEISAQATFTILPNSPNYPTLSADTISLSLFKNNVLVASAKMPSFDMGPIATYMQQ